MSMHENMQEKRMKHSQTSQIQHYAFSPSQKLLLSQNEMKNKNQFYCLPRYKNTVQYDEARHPPRTFSKLRDFHTKYFITFSLLFTKELKDKCTNGKAVSV